jgi:hypothetical protein
MVRGRMSTIPEGSRKDGCGESNVSRFETLDGLLEIFSHSLFVKGLLQRVSDEDQPVVIGIGEEVVEEKRLGLGDGSDIVGQMLRDIGVIVNDVLLGSGDHAVS